MHVHQYVLLLGTRGTCITSKKRSKRNTFPISIYHRIQQQIKTQRLRTIIMVYYIFRMHLYLY